MPKHIQLLSIPVILLCWVHSSAAAGPDYWPGEAWRTSTPEAQGMSSSRLADMLEVIDRRGYDLDNITIVRNGFVVADVYFHPFQAGQKHIIHSCTKSVLSALIGIAIEQGSINGVDQSVFDFFPEHRPAVTDSLRGAINLRHLLMMASGFDCTDSYKHNFDGMARLRRSPDWATHVLNLPMREMPGTRFEYCNGASYLLAAVLQKAAGTTALDFAREHLFGPMGISDVSWPRSPQGVNFGWGEMRLAPLDMARFGYLYLHGGQWGDQQLVPETWVKDSTRPHIIAGTLSEDYGYQWWVDYGGYFMALGYGGQMIVVEPDRELVVVFTSSLPGRDFFVPEKMFADYIVPAAQAEKPLPEDPLAGGRLDSLIASFANPEPAAVVPLPPLAMEVSGRTISFHPNELSFKSYLVSFEPGASEARFELTTDRGGYSGRIGLDGVHRLDEAAGEIRGYKGQWENGATFVISFQVVGRTSKGTARIRFGADEVTFELTDSVRGIHHRLTGSFID